MRRRNTTIIISVLTTYTTFKCHVAQQNYQNFKHFLLMLFLQYSDDKCLDFSLKSFVLFLLRMHERTLRWGTPLLMIRVIAKHLIFARILRRQRCCCCYNYGNDRPVWTRSFQFFKKMCGFCHPYPIYFNCIFI